MRDEWVQNKSDAIWDSNDVIGMSPLFSILAQFINDIIETKVLALTMSLKVKRDKISTDREEYSDEEKRMVAVVGGRARGLVLAIRRIERGRAGWNLPNLTETMNEQVRRNRQKVGMPHGRAEALDRLIPRLVGLQVWGLSSLSSVHNTPSEPINGNNQVMPPQTCPGRVRGRVRSCDLPQQLHLPLKTIPHPLSIL